MKKTIACLLAVTLFSLSLAACAQDSGGSAKETDPASTTEAKTDTETDMETESEAEATTEINTEYTTDAATEAESKTETEAETTGETQAELSMDTEAVTKIESEAVTEIEPETEARTEVDTEAAPEVETVDYDAYLTLEPEAPAEGEGMTISGVDISEFSIVRSADMPEGQITALEMFAAQVQKVTGAALPIITDDQTADHEIVIGDTNRQNTAVTAAVSEIDDDGYAIVVDSGDLYISATTGRGVVYGMCDFLENYMGVRLYAIDFIYHRNVGAITLNEGMKVVFSPEFHARRTWIDKLVADPLDNVIFLKNNSDGLKKAKVGDPVVVRANSNHTIDKLADMKGANPCPSDEAVYQTVLANVMEKLEENLLQNTIQVGQVDGSEPCRCANCKAVNEPYGTENAAWFLFINRLADEANAKFPERDVKIITYSYQFTHGVPGNGFTVSDNVIINFCFDDACYNHAFDDPGCAKNVPVVAELREWAKLCKADNLYVYEYAYNCGDATLPDPNILVMWDNFRLYLECGVNGILSEGIQSKGGDFDYLRAYLRAKLVWNPHMTRDEYFTLLKQFMVDYYGDAAPLMIEYLKILGDGKRNYCTDMYTPMYTFYCVEGGTEEKDISQDILLQCQALFDEALALETLTEEQKNHVEYTAIHLFLVRWKYFPKDDPDGKTACYKTIYQFRNKYGV
ncbi:MAG: DUF4838 domain-containing protein [Ruminococcaceae bacterium]|nr:DUF4838 domain-containing protein [Oscillospiraceae bacterium]